MYVQTDVVDGCAVSKLVQLGPSETPPSWDGEDFRSCCRHDNVPSCFASWCSVGKEGMDPYNSPYVIPIVPFNSFRHSLPPRSGILQDPRDRIEGGQWKGVVGGVCFRGEQMLHSAKSAYNGASVDMYGDLSDFTISKVDD